MNEYCRLKIIDACYKNKFCDWRLAHTMETLSTWYRIYFVCVKKCHNKNRFGTTKTATAAAAAAKMPPHKTGCIWNLAGVPFAKNMLFLVEIDVCLFPCSPPLCCYRSIFRSVSLYMFDFFCRSLSVDSITISYTISRAMPLTIINVHHILGWFFLSLPSLYNANLRYIWIKCANFWYMSFCQLENDRQFGPITKW